MPIKTEHYISGSTLGPIQCSAGGVPYNKEHLDAKDAEIARLQSKLDAAEQRLAEERIALMEEISDQRKKVENREARLKAAESKLEKSQDELGRTRNLLVAIVQSLKAGNSAEDVLETIGNGVGITEPIPEPEEALSDE